MLEEFQSRFLDTQIHYLHIVSSPHTVSVLATLPEIPNRTDFQCSSNFKNQRCYAHAAFLSPKISITSLSSYRDNCDTVYHERYSAAPRQRCGQQQFSRAALPPFPPSSVHVMDVEEQVHMLALLHKIICKKRHMNFQ